MAVAGPLGIEIVRSVELALIPVGRSPVEEDAFTPFDLVASDLSVLAGGAADTDKRTVETQQLLHCARDQLGPRPEEGEDLGLVAEAEHGHAEYAGGRFEASEYQQLDRAHG